MRVELNQTKNGLSALTWRSMKSLAAGEELLVDRLHALAGQRAGVLDLAVGGRLEHAARAELLAELGVLRIVGILGLLLGVEVVEVAEELVEAVRRGQELVAVAQVVLAELRGGSSRAA